MKVHLRDLKPGRFSQSETYLKETIVFTDPSIVPASHFDVTLDADKFELTIMAELRFAGSVFTECDRCLETIELPVDDHFHVIISRDAELLEQDHPDVDVIREIGVDDIEIDITSDVIEGIQLSVPMRRVHPEIDGKTCLELATSSDDAARDESVQSLANNPALQKLKQQMNGDDA